jgi:beta propeller repeat protein
MRKLHPTRIEERIRECTFFTVFGFVVVVLAGAVKEARADFEAQPVCIHPARQEAPSISGDKIVWVDYRNGNADIYMWDPNNGEQAICTNPSYQTNPTISGNMVVWEDGRTFDSIYMWSPLFGEKPVLSLGMHPFKPSISGDIVVWQDERNINQDIYGRQIDLNTGIVLKEFSICINPASQQNPSISGDIVVWQDNRNKNWDIYAYNIRTEKEFVICDKPFDQFNPSISGDVVVWEDFRNGNGDIYSCKISTGEERPVCTNFSIQRYPSISGDVVVWMDYRNDRTWIPEDSNPDIYMWHAINGEYKVATSLLGDYTPSISGNKIVWVRAAGGQTDIYMTQIPSPLKTLKTDLNNDGIVDFKDLAEFVEQWLAREQWFNSE